MLGMVWTQPLNVFSNSACIVRSKLLFFVVGIVTTSGPGGTAKHLVKLLPGQTLSSITHKLTPQQQQAYRITLLKQQQQQQQRLQQQSQQQSSQQIQQRRQQQTSQPGQTQPSTTAIETAPKSASPVRY